MAPYEALYDRKYRLPIHWDEAGERQFLGPELVEQATEAIKKIRERIKTAQSRQKSYADRRRRPLEFEPGEKVFHKIFSHKGDHSIQEKRKAKSSFHWTF